MSSVKMSDKDLLERLAAKILLKTGKKFTQQELLSRCVQFSDNKLDEFLASVVKENRKWTKEEVHKLHEKYITDFGEGTERLSSEIDKILYGE